MRRANYSQNELRKIKELIRFQLKLCYMCDIKLRNLSQRFLEQKYSESSDYLYSRDINNIILTIRTPIVIKYIDDKIYDDRYEYLWKYLSQRQSKQLLKEHQHQDRYVARFFDKKLYVQYLLHHKLQENLKQRQLHGLLYNQQSIQRCQDLPSSLSNFLKNISPKAKLKQIFIKNEYSTTNTNAYMSVERETRQVKSQQKSQKSKSKCQTDRPRKQRQLSLRHIDKLLYVLSNTKRNSQSGQRTKRTRKSLII
ncbi:hypothetical protein pb186bvf_016390 [Paramecium bursaria]